MEIIAVPPQERNGKAIELIGINPNIINVLKRAGMAMAAVKPPASRRSDEAAAQREAMTAPQRIIMKANSKAVIRNRYPNSPHPATSAESKVA